MNYGMGKMGKGMGKKDDKKDDKKKPPFMKTPGRKTIMPVKPKKNK